MRISDWSSDVCSSDLLRKIAGFELDMHVRWAKPRPETCWSHRSPRELANHARQGLGVGQTSDRKIVRHGPGLTPFRPASRSTSITAGPRSEERRVGTEWCSTWRSRGLP